MARGLPRSEAAPLNFWNKLATRSQSNLYFALMFLDRDRREAFRDVYRFVRAADDVADTPGEPADILSRLTTWRTELAAVYEGRATHPYARRLTGVVRDYGLPRQPFDRLLDALEADVARTHIADEGELHRYCEAVAGSIAEPSLRILGIADDPTALGYAQRVGAALQLSNIVRDVREDARAGRVYLPADQLARAGVTIAELGWTRTTPAGVSAICRGLANRARALIHEGRAALSPGLQHQLLVPEIWADVYLALLAEMERSDFDVMGPPPYLRRRSKLAIALRRWAQQSFPSAALFRAPGLW